MSARSGVFTTYVIDFADAKFKVSNDVTAISAGDLLLDAEITVIMDRDTAGTTFKIVLYNLPQVQLDTLDAAIKDKSYLQKVNICLGYLETKALPVVEGIYEKIETTVAADSTTGQNRLMTTITGKEKALRACSDAKYSCTLSDDNAHDLTSAVKSVLAEVNSDRNKNDHPGIETLVDWQTPHITGGLKGLTATTFNNNMILSVLSEMVSNAKPPKKPKSPSNAKPASNPKPELLIVDGKVYLGAPIAYDPDPPGTSGITLDPTINLAQFSKVKVKVKSKDASDKTPPGKDDAPTDATIHAVKFTALGDPTMRPGQKVTFSGLKAPTFSGLKDPVFASSDKEWRINTVTHQLSGSAGYTCIGDAVDPDNAAAARGAIKASAASSAQDVAGAIKSQPGKNPVIEVASVKAAADKKMFPYQADLYYGQTGGDGQTGDGQTGGDGQTPGDAQQPSIQVPITASACQLYRHRPIASPFAWRNCGLVTPVYPAMKTLVAHNAGLATDGIVTGYIWSNNPALPPPPNEPGDWWLCLPIDVNATSLLPKDTDLTAVDKEGKSTFKWADWDWTNFDKTKAANDLTSGAGKRVIEVKGLKITVGADKLAKIGMRPSEGPNDDFLIEHASGTSIHIDSNGALMIAASGTSVQIDAHGVMTIDASNASLTIKGNVVVEGNLEIK